MSKNETFKGYVTDNDIVLGKKEGTLEISFQRIINSDK